jgi:two-component system alkaline phosphatase synthesis response regulator PhoP
VGRYYRKAMPKPTHPEFAVLEPAQRERIEKLAALLRIADGLDARHSEVVNDVSVRREKGRNRARRAGRRRYRGRTCSGDAQSGFVRAGFRRSPRDRSAAGGVACMNGSSAAPADAARKKILLVDDEAAIVQSLRYTLEKNGYAVLTAGDGRTAVTLASAEAPDLVLLDIMLPLLDGIEACKQIRKVSAVPIIMLTAKDQEFDKVLALELGADDYVTKPFSLGEIMARIKARLRRQDAIVEAHKNESISIGEITIDPSRQRLTVRGNDVALAPKEFRLLHLLMENRGRIVTRQILLEKVWGYDFEGEHQTISVHIRWLREKIEIDPNNPRHIATVRSRGYMFRE